MVDMNLQYFGGRGSGGGKGSAGGGKAIKFTESEKQIRVVNPDGTKEVLQKGGGTNLYDRKNFTSKTVDENTTVETWQESVEYTTKKGSVFRVTEDVRLRSYRGFGQFDNKVTTKVSKVVKIK